MYVFKTAVFTEMVTAAGFPKDFPKQLKKDYWWTIYIEMWCPPNKEGDVWKNVNTNCSMKGNTSQI